jgi:hypothetical protein
VNRRFALIGAAVLAVAIVAFGVARYRTRGGTKVTATGAAKIPPSPAERRAERGERITVEVLNATRVRGLARRAALTLRDNGFDVVATGTNREQFDSTQILDRTGHRDWASRAAKAMGGGTVLVRPDSSRDVDLTVLIGASWHPPSQPFYP